MAYEPKFQRREIFSKRASYASVKLEPKEVARLDKLATRMRSQRAGAIRAAIRKGLATLRA